MTNGLSNSYQLGESTFTAKDKDAFQPVTSHSLIGDFVVRSKHDISSFYRDTPGIWMVGVAEKTCSGRPDQPETRKTGFLPVGPMLFDILHSIPYM